MARIIFDLRRLCAVFSNDLATVSLARNANLRTVKPSYEICSLRFCVYLGRKATIKVVLTPPLATQIVSRRKNQEPIIPTKRIKKNMKWKSKELRNWLNNPSSLFLTGTV